MLATTGARRLQLVRRRWCGGGFGETEPVARLPRGGHPHPHTTRSSSTLSPHILTLQILYFWSAGNVCGCCYYGCFTSYILWLYICDVVGKVISCVVGWGSRTEVGGLGPMRAPCSRGGNIYVYRWDRTPYAVGVWGTHSGRDHLGTGLEDRWCGGPAGNEFYKFKPI